MTALFLFDIKRFFKRWSTYVLLTLIVALGVVIGKDAHFTISESVYQNSPYQISFITALFSLSAILFSTILVAQHANKELDHNFQQIFFSTPIRKNQFIGARFASLLTISFFLTVLFTGSFLFGHQLSASNLKSESVSWLYYIQPVLLFTFINTLLITAVLSFVGWISKNKLIIYVSGLLLYMIYTVTLIYSGSPLIAGALPQSEQSRLISAVVDPFGMSAYFYQTSSWTVEQRNTQLISIKGLFALNRMIVVLVSLLFLFLSVRKFSFSKRQSRTPSKSKENTHENNLSFSYKRTPTQHNAQAQAKSLLSFSKIHLTYIVKSIPFILALLCVLFTVGMEMYAAIEKGLRIPQQYVSSGLMTNTIIQHFYELGLIIVLYYAFDIFWRSNSVRFDLIENSTANTSTAYFSKWISLTAVALIFTIALIFEGIVFQLLYNYPAIEWKVYGNLLLFITLPLILMSGFLLLIKKIINRKYVGLGVAILFVLIMATSIGKNFITHPLAKILHVVQVKYSDMNGFGIYGSAYLKGIFFELCCLVALLCIYNLVKKTNRSWQVWMLLIGAVSISSYTGIKLLDGYKPKSETAGLTAQANYETQYRKYSNRPQPTVTSIITTVDLFPEENAYHIKGSYTLENKTNSNIDSILVNFANDFKIESAALQIADEIIRVKDQYQVLALQKALMPNQKATFHFNISYQWKAVNGHQSFNAIVENGSFIRISRYYPHFGYVLENEIEDDAIRKKYKLGAMSATTRFDAPKTANDDFITLDMTISTSGNQTALGIGELTKNWKQQNRNYFQYKTNDLIPFRFGISSAQYAVKKENYKGKSIEIYFHPTHAENVDHLMNNARLTMDYCETNFANYPFETIRFAEVSGFTSGFAATAYPTTIYMTENMVFHSNIKADKQQDVINELAGHELAHLWWGNNQINPDDRDGSAMLTETLAMYTEMMLLKKMHGKEKMLDRIKMHLDIYSFSKGFSIEQPLYKVQAGETHISYSKGAVVMYLLSELIGEQKINEVLRSFIEKHKFPYPKPVSTDFLTELYRLTNPSVHPKIDTLFKKIEPLSVEVPLIAENSFRQ
ncbi:M1 family aminopeptidase [Pseudobacter ginsenosidimutans]|uniref:Peptidase M1-like protein n=1 Tax=Pseudobacter ginsenosidimutans TaxID=661488 RepID=A0A4Q7MWG9_9BACT|nr:M1 family aminopeptidase [Pseudobacter ginsenosidimutans]RZS71503.1 peptidase M1-like protein [Pseudobacter ginsenosidimutans]